MFRNFWFVSLRVVFFIQFLTFIFERFFTFLLLYSISDSYSVFASFVKQSQNRTSNLCSEFLVFASPQDITYDPFYEMHFLQFKKFSLQYHISFFINPKCGKNTIYVHICTYVVSQAVKIF